MSIAYRYCSAYLTSLSLRGPDLAHWCRRYVSLDLAMHFGLLIIIPNISIIIIHCCNHHKD